MAGPVENNRILSWFSRLSRFVRKAPLRFQIAYRRPLLASLLDEPIGAGIDGLEIVAEEFLGASTAGLRELDRLAARFPITVRGTSLSLGSLERPSRRHLRALRRLLDRVGARRLTEQLGIARSGAVELAQPAVLPWTRGVAVRVAAHVAEARDLLQRPILLENVAALVTPPAKMWEGEFLREVTERADCELCLDLHAYLANLVNVGPGPREGPELVPYERVREVHLAGGRVLARGRFTLLDSHDAPASPEVMRLFRRVAARAPGLEVVTLERDDRIPSLRALKRELDVAREAYRKEGSRVVVA